MESVGARFGGVLIVEDGARLAESLRREFTACSDRVVVASGVVDAMAALAGAAVFDLVVVDVRLPDGSGLDVASRALARTPMPLVVAMSGEASPAESFGLARLGVHAYVQKPLTMAALITALERAAEQRVPVAMHARSAVGRVPLHELEAEVRDAMLGEAIARTQGSRRGAARLLSVSRQLMQHMLRGR